MKERNVALALAYYQAMQNKDVETLEKFLHPNVHLLSPMTEQIGKEAVLEAVKRLLPFFTSLTVRAHCGSDNQATVIYDLHFPQPIGAIRTAVLLTFQDELIINYELFFDARPFTKQ
jgi:hypothetical protein